MPGILRAQSTSKPVRMGLLSDMGGPYRDVGGPGNRVGVELAVADFGGSVLDRPIEVLQGDIQNKPDVSSALARGWIDSQGVDTIIACGETTSGCVRASVVDGATYRYRMGVVEECCFDRTQASHWINLFDMHQKYADVIKKAEAIQYFDTIAASRMEKLAPLAAI